MMQTPVITSRRFGTALTSFRSISGVEWCQARRYAVVGIPTKKIKPHSDACVKKKQPSLTESRNDVIIKA